MGIVVDEKKCHGCINREEPLCVKNCPGDLIKKEKNSRTVEFRSTRDCWDCMVCIKLCPSNALETRLPYQLASYKASLFPRIKGNKIIWQAENIKGRKEKFESQIMAE
ncbi:MAG: indolepyruvate ferredoxin oxidoreductase subunit alpha [Halanaerobiaceae bacterium]